MAWTTKIYSFASSISNLWRQPTRRENLTYDKYLPYFDDFDNFPLKWHKAISESPSATACVSTIQDFLEGVDFSDPELGKRVVNPRGETFFQIHQKTCRDFGEFEGFYWHFMYDGTGKITEWYVLPFENCRLGRPDDKGFISKILHNPYFGTKDFKISRDTTYFNSYNPKYVREQIGKEGERYRGQVLFVGTTTALSRFYPMPEAYSAFNWFETEAGIARYFREKIKNGFLKSFMLIMRGNPNEPSKNPEFASVPEGERKTKGQEFDEVIGQNFMGADNAGTMMVQWVDNPEEKPDILAFPENSSTEMFLTADQQATKKITTAWKVPAILANIHEGVSLGGDGNQVRVSVKLMQQRSIKKQRILTDSYQMIFKNFSTPYAKEITIAPYNPYPELEVLDQKIWDAMTDPERRDWIEKNTEIVLFDDDLTTDAALPVPTQARLSNALPVPFSDKIRSNARRALEYQDKAQLRCGGRGGRQVAEMIVNNENMGLKQLKRIYSYLKKNEKFSNSAYSDGCGAIEYQAWGGKDMFEFLDVKLKELDKWLN
jgi:hypothetical protein